MDCRSCSYYEPRGFGTGPVVEEQVGSLTAAIVPDAAAVAGEEGRQLS